MFGALTVPPICGFWVKVYAAPLPTKIDPKDGVATIPVPPLVTGIELVKLIGSR